MSSESPSRSRPRRLAYRVGFFIGSVALLAPPAAHALTSTWENLTLSLDSTFSMGGIYRLADPDRDLYGLTNGGTQYSVNSDDGNLNYRKGWASQVFKGTHDLEIKSHNFSAFVRGSYFYDTENKDNDRARTPLSDETLDRVGAGAQWLDMYVRGKFDLAGHALDLRFGRQVLNLGESTFIPNGINVVNPVDVSRLRVPGAELREALLPVNMLKASFAASDNLTVEAFWMLEFRRTEIDPAGSYFATNDFASRGGSQVFLGFGSLSDRQSLGAIPRDLDQEGNNYSQFGIDLHYTAASLGETDFGLYFVNYHSRLPVISARTPTGPVTSAVVVGALANLLIQNGAATPSTAPTAATSLLTTAATNPGALSPTQLALIAGAKKVALLTLAATGRYFNEYPEDIRLLGVSFNTTLGQTGVAMQGEIGYKHHVPLQIDDVELLYATLSALDSPGGTTYGQNNQLGDYRAQYSTYVPGYKRFDVWSAQATFTKVFGPMLRASQLTVLGEIGGLYVPNLPGKDQLRFDGAATFTSGSQSAMANTGFASTPATPLSAFADRFSCGYQVIAKLDYNNLFAGVNFSPTLGFTHDVTGNSPLPLGNYLHGRKSINIAGEFVWKNAWSLELRYVNYFGAGNYNLIADRDFVASTIKYSF